MKIKYIKEKSPDTLNRIKKLIPSYLPEWKPDINEPGWAVAQIFAFMQEEITERINYIPYNLFVEFMESLGIKPQTAVPSEGYVIFKQSKNLKNPVLINKNQKLKTQSGVIFETVEDMYINPVSVESIISVDPKTDSIVDHISHQKSIFSFSPQNHYFYVGDDTGFYFIREEGKKLFVKVKPPLSGIWEYYSNGKWKKLFPETLRKISRRVVVTKWRQPASFGEIDLYGKRFPVKPVRVITEQTGYFYYKIDPKPTEKTTVNGVNSYWLRVRLYPYHRMLEENRFIIESRSGLSSIFFNDIPLDIEFNRPVQPFGEEPKPGDIFYISSDEAFSKKGGTVNIKVSFEGDYKFFKNDDQKFRKISYEYWNGKSWKYLYMEIKDSEEGGNKQDIRFKVPEDISKVEVNGEEHFFIRFRLLDFVYGSFKVADNEVKPDFTPPRIKSIEIDLELEKEPEHSFVYNNLEFKNFEGDLYQPVPERFKTLFIGLKGTVSEVLNLFFSIENKNWIREKIIQWKYWNGTEWEDLKIYDQTEGFKKSGVVKILIPEDITTARLFQKELIWIKALFQYKGDLEDEEIQLNCVYPNGVKVKQIETVEDLILGSSNGDPDQRFEIGEKNIQEILVYIKEPFKPEKEEYIEEEGNFWVRWSEVSDFSGYSSDSRVFKTDRINGIIFFGDGVNGKIPPKGKNNIKISYRFGGGEKGNVQKNEINSLSRSLPFIEEVFNPERFYGGKDSESFEELFRRLSELLRHRGRSVNIFDFERLIKQRFNDVVKVKIIPNLNRHLRYQPGWLSIVVYNDHEGLKTDIQTGFLYEIQRFTESLSPVTANINVIPPEFVFVDLSVTVVTDEISKINQMKSTVKEKVEQFLNPVKGGDSGRGWEFGKLPNYSDFFPVITSVKDVVYVKEMTVTLRKKDEELPLSESTSLDLLESFREDYLIITPGKIDLKVDLGG
ncbi:baseplate J/gp47 family protein [Persephonella sp.]